MSPRYKIASLAAVISITVLVMLGVAHIGSPRVVARAITPDGVELCVVQECNWDAEPFTTGFVVRKPGSQWEYFYYDHQDWYWGRGSISLNSTTKIATVYRGDRPVIYFSWPAETYVLNRRSTPATYSSSEMPAGWSPGMPLFSRK